MSVPSLRILQVLRSPIGGLYRHVTDLSGELARRGHKVGLVMDSTLRDVQTEARLTPIAPMLELGVHRLPVPRLFGPADLTTPLRLRKLARDLEIGIIHGHGAKGGFLARLARLGNRHAAAVYTPHGGVLHYDTASLAGGAFLKMEAALLGATDAVIFESRFARETYLERIGRPECPVKVIHNGLTRDEFAPVGAAADSADFAFVGELRDIKGIFVLLDALTGLQSGNSRPVRLIVAGDGPAREQVTARIAALGLEDRVELAGVQPARQVFARGKCAIVPSLAESLPYVVLEAAGAGKPLIATNVGGIPELFGPTAGALIPPGDAAALQKAMQGFLDAPRAAEQEALLRFEHVRQDFSATHMCDQVEEVYAEALAARKR